MNNTTLISYDGGATFVPMSNEFKHGDDHAIAFDEDAYSLGLSGSSEYDTDVIRFTYSSMTTPGRPSRPWAFSVSSSVRSSTSSRRRRRR